MIFDILEFIVYKSVEKILALGIANRLYLKHLRVLQDYETCVIE